MSFRTACATWSSAINDEDKKFCTSIFISSLLTLGKPTNLKGIRCLSIYPKKDAAPCFQIVLVIIIQLISTGSLL
jgi:hypothetical protein